MMMMMMNEVCAGQGAALSFIGIGRGALCFFSEARVRQCVSAFEARTRQCVGAFER